MKKDWYKMRNKYSGLWNDERSFGINFAEFANNFR